MAQCPDILASPPGSPERQAAIDCQKARLGKKRIVSKAGSMVKTPAPPQGNAGKSPLQSAVDTFKSGTYRTG